jgi:ABC-type dipeptide/oligopeptide/nickel transport system ATPase subunit
MGVIMRQQTAICQTGWRVRDFVTLAIINVVMIVVLLGITMLFTALFTPVGSYLAAVGVAALINGPVFLAFAAENLGMAPERIRRRIDGTARRLGIAHLLNRTVHMLSSGEKQRVALAARRF